ncbi:hypothetical protein BGY98DRAFT_578012 [Russula aff. rugulosa BPL654]|nr:hypothetical protein BGY98DRAFT_578012 [Russula aff. rugulosa BPL654]
MHQCFSLHSIKSDISFHDFCVRYVVFYTSITVSLLDFTPWSTVATGVPLYLSSFPRTVTLAHRDWQSFFSFIDCVSSASLVDRPRAVSSQRVCRFIRIRRIFCECPPPVRDTLPALSVTAPSSQHSKPLTLTHTPRHSKASVPRVRWALLHLPCSSEAVM